MEVRKVLILQRRLTKYRLPFFEMLRTHLRQQDIELSVAYGISTDQETLRQDEGVLSWGCALPSRYFCVGQTPLLWQSLPLSWVSAKDLVVLSHESALLVNYWLLGYSSLRGRPLTAFWGHGKNFQQEKTNRFKEAWKRMLLRAPDWWFGYTDLTREVLLQANYPENRITIVQNAIDTRGLLADADRCSENDVNELRQTLGLRGRNVGVFCGSLYQGKRLDLVLEAAIRIRKRIEDFELLIIGSGPQESVVREAAATHDWIRYVGKRIGREKVLYLKLAHVFLLPHIVGLAILDSFALGLPIMTMNNNSHSPEIAYLRHSENGLMCENRVESYSEQVIDLLEDPVRLAAMSDTCRRDARLYTIENMVSNFSNGIRECLSIRW